MTYIQSFPPQLLTTDAKWMFAGLNFVALSILFLTVFIFPAFKPGLRSIPGPFIAKFTNLWRFLDTWKGYHYENLMQLHGRHGSVVRIGPNVLSISNPDAIESIYGAKAGFVKSEMYRVFEKNDRGKVIPSVVATRDKKAHTAYKKTIARTFTVGNLTRSESVVEQAIRQLLIRLDLEAASTGKRCNISIWFQFFTTDCITEMTFSRSFSLLENGFDRYKLLPTLLLLTSYAAVVAQMPWIDRLLRQSPIFTFFQGKKLSQLAVHAQKLLDSRLESTALDPGDFISQLLTYQDEHPERLTSEAIFGHVMTNIFAGSESTSIALRACTYFLCRHPESLHTLQSELRTCDDLENVASPNSARPMFIPWETARKLPFLGAVINETLRLHPPGAILSERIVSGTGLQLDGFNIPPGTIVGMNGWLTQRDASIFGPDADTFRPERWLQAEAESSESWNARLLRMKRAMLPFGHGPTTCLGKEAALLELYKCIPALYQAFHIELAEPEKEWKIVGRFGARQSDMDVKLTWRECAREKFKIEQGRGGIQVEEKSVSF